MAKQPAKKKPTAKAAAASKQKQKKNSSPTWKATITVERVNNGLKTEVKGNGESVLLAAALSKCASELLMSYNK